MSSFFRECYSFEANEVLANGYYLADLHEKTYNVFSTKFTYVKCAIRGVFLVN